MMNLAILDFSENHDGSELVVCVTMPTDEGKTWVAGVSHPYDSMAMAEIMAVAFQSLLSTPQGEAQVNEYIHFDWKDEDWDSIDSCGTHAMGHLMEAAFESLSSTPQGKALIEEYDQLSFRKPPKSRGCRRFISKTLQ